jgi:2,3-bisphosphoglycerate-independent phosphoglycerate mutase
VGPILEGLAQYDDYRVLLLPDHPTPLSLRTHTSEPVPYVLYQKSLKKASGAKGYDEFQAKESGILLSEGHRLMDKLIV